MKGRWSYDGVNSAVDEYNNALSNRYNFLNKGFQAMASAASKKRFKVKFDQKKCRETDLLRNCTFLLGNEESRIKRNSWSPLFSGRRFEKM